MCSLNEKQKEKLANGVKEIFVSLTNIDDSRSHINDVLDMLQDECAIDKKIVRKLATMYHKGTYQDFKNSQEEIFDIYESLFK